MSGTACCLQYKDFRDVVLYLKNRRENSSIDGTVVTSSMLMSTCLRKEPEARYWKSNGINGVLNDMIPGWFDTKTLLSQYIVLDQIITEESRTLNSKQASTIRQNRQEIMDSVRLLIEIGLDADKIPAVSSEERIFQKIYKRFCNECASVKYFMNATEGWKHPKHLRALLNFAGVDCYRYNKIYFQGFYYITPLQGRFVKALLDADIDIVYLNNYDKDVKEAYKVWDINEWFAGCEKDEIRSSAGDECRFAEVFREKYTRPAEINDISLVKYSDIYEFIYDMSKLSQAKHKYLCPRANEIRETVDAFFSRKGEDGTKSHLMAYPIGQYLFALYGMWDREEQKLIFDCDKIRKCIASGWAGKGGEPYKSIRIFDTAKAFFEDCRTFEDWNEKIELILDIREKVFPLFGSDDSDRWTEIMGNPLSPVGIYSISEDDWEKLTGVLQNIFDDAEYLFSSVQNIDIEEHFENLSKVISQHMSRKRIDDDERQIIEKLKIRLKYGRIDIRTCSADNLAGAMSFLLGGDIDRFREQAETEEQENTGISISDISDLEAAVYSRKDIITKFHLCFCDDQNIPGKSRNFPWPLSERLLTAVRNIDNDISKRIRNYITFNDNSRYENRYLLYRFMQLTGTEISYVEKYNGKPHAKSPYMTVLENLYGIKCAEYNDNDNNKARFIGEQCAEESLEAPDNIEKYEILDQQAERCAEIQFNRVVCPYRNLYDFGLYNKPIFTSKFHLGFYASNLLKSMVPVATRKGETDEVYRSVFQALPMFSPSEEKEIISFSSFGGERDIMDADNTYKDVKYRGERMYLKYLSGKDIDNYYRNPLNFEWENRCVYCPHGSNCIYRKRGEADE